MLNSVTFIKDHNVKFSNFINDYIVKFGNFINNYNVKIGYLLRIIMLNLVTY